MADHCIAFCVEMTPWMPRVLGVLAVLCAMPRPTSACCTLYLSRGGAPVATPTARTVVMQAGRHVVLTTVDHIDGPAENTLMLVPVDPTVRAGDVSWLLPDVVERLDAFTGPQLAFERWGFPCPRHRHAFVFDPNDQVPEVPWLPAGSFDPPDSMNSFAPRPRQHEGITLLAPSDIHSLTVAITERGYTLPPGAQDVLARVLHGGWHFVIAEVPAGSLLPTDFEVRTTAPLRIEYESDVVTLPVEIGQINAPLVQDFTVFALTTASRYELAAPGWTNVFAPTGLGLTEQNVRFPTFYAAVLQATIAEAGGHAVVTEYVGNAGVPHRSVAPPMSDAELAELGGDVLHDSVHGDDRFSRATEFVVSRLHTQLHKTEFPLTFSLRMVSPVSDRAVRLTRAALQTFRFPDGLDRWADRALRPTPAAPGLDPTGDVGQVTTSGHPFPRPEALDASPVVPPPQDVQSGVFLTRFVKREARTSTERWPDDACDYFCPFGDGECQDAEQGLWVTQPGPSELVPFVSPCCGNGRETVATNLAYQTDPSFSLAGTVSEYVVGPPREIPAMFSRPPSRLETPPPNRPLPRTCFCRTVGIPVRSSATVWTWLIVTLTALGYRRAKRTYSYARSDAHASQNCNGARRRPACLEAQMSNRHCTDHAKDLRTRRGAT